MIEPAASLARNATNGATFSGASASNCPSGSRSSPKVLSVIRVLAPGAIAFTVTPYRCISMATICVKAAIPAFAAP